MNLREKTEYLLFKYSIKPDPNKGQHFLIDYKTIVRMILALDLKPSDVVVEIGAGTGNITRILAKHCKVIAIEKDKRFYPILRKLKAKVIIGDALKLLPKLKFNKLIGNLPFTMCEALFRKLKNVEFERAVFLVPKSFYEKLKSKVELIAEVPPQAFFPEPNTEAVVIKV